MSVPAPTVPPSASSPTLSVIICCYTTDRIDALRAAIDSVTAQIGTADEAIVVVDHNPELLGRLRADDTTRRGVRVVPNDETRGLSGARNTGLAAARGDVVVFLDDDAALEPQALSGIRTRLAGPEIVAVGGAVDAQWDDDRVPSWFPPEFGWVVGCDYRGLPADGATIRNPIGAAMAVRRDELTAIGGFSHRLGRRGTFPAGCEETLMGIALREHFPSSDIVRDTAFRVRHRVTADRATVRYFLHRCFQEGRSKAVLATLASTSTALSSERSYAARTLTSGLWSHRRTPLRALALVVGFTFTTAGFVVGAVATRLRATPREDS